MATHNTWQHALLIPILLLMAACASQQPTTPSAGSVPQPASVTVLQLDAALADSANVAANLVASLYNSGKISLASAQTVKGYLTTVATASNAIATEANSSDSWATMRVKIAGYLASAAISASGVDPQLASAVTAVQALVTKILGVQ